MSLLQVKNLTKIFFLKKGQTTVLKNLCFDIKEQTIFSLIGESGSGKTTLAKILLGLEEKTNGEIFFENKPVTYNLEFRKNAQIIFQNPFSSFNPLHKVKSILLEPLRIHSLLSKEQQKRKIEKILSEFNLEKRVLESYPHELSGGEAQRIAIARALLLRPKLLILDEPLSSIDVQNQKNILALLKKLKQKYSLSYLFISHDLNVIKDFSDQTAVLCQGEIVEIKETKKLFAKPLHSYTKELLKTAML